jgi:5-methylcytosine-specific restriction endonuclease McrA
MGSTQTGSKRGHFKYGDLHPEIQGLIFRGYGKRKSGAIGEDWTTKKKLDERKKKQLAYNKTTERRAINAERQRRIYHENPELCRSFTKRWCENNKETIREKNKKYRENNRAYFTEAEARRRDKCRPVGNRDIIRQFYKAARRLSLCTKIDWQVDHIVPISLGGKHSHDNLQVVPRRWNQIKKNTNTNRINIL